MKKDNIPEDGSENFLWKGHVDKRDVLAILENSVARLMVMRNNPKYIRRDPNYGVLSGKIPVLSATLSTKSEWCAVQDQQGNWSAQLVSVPVYDREYISATSQIPLLSTGIWEQQQMKLQVCDAYPTLDTQFTEYSIVQQFDPRTALCAICAPSNMNSDAMTTLMVGVSATGEYQIGLSATGNGFGWTLRYPSVWLDNEKAFGGQISSIHNIASFGVLESAGWGGTNGHWICGRTDLTDPTSILTAKTGVAFRRVYAEWYNPRSRYVGLTYGGSEPNAPITQFYYDPSFISAFGAFIVKDLGEYDYDTGEEISSFWGIFQPETPSVWPRSGENRIGQTPPTSIDIYNSYYNLSRMDTLGVWLPWQQNEVSVQIVGTQWSDYNGQRTTERIVLSSNERAIPDYQWMFNGTAVNWNNFRTAFHDPFTEYTRKSHSAADEYVEAGCRFTGNMLSSWSELSSNFDHCTVWYWNNTFDRYGEVQGVWYIVPVIGYSARWKSWYDVSLMRDYVEFDHLDVKVNLFAVKASTAEDQTLKSWRAYMGNSFWNNINKINWENCMPPAPPEPEFPPLPSANEINVYNNSMRCCKMIGPTLAVVKYKWKEGQEDDGVHYIPRNLPLPRYTWQKPWEQTEDEPIDETPDEQTEPSDEDESEEEMDNTPRLLNEENFYTAINKGTDPVVENDAPLSNEDDFMAKVVTDDNSKTLTEDDLLIAMSGGKTPFVDASEAGNLKNGDFYFG